MSLRIVFDEGISTDCSPGSVLSGHLNLLAAKQQSLGEVSITFAGRCKVTIRRSNGQSTSYYHSKGYFFSQRQQLHRGDFTFQTGTYTWPFRFVMPAHADPGLVVSQNAKGDTFDPKLPWRGTNSEELHPLPASFSGPTSSGKDKCSVEYYLKAEVTPPSHGAASLFSRTIDEKVMLNFRQFMLDQGFEPGLFKSDRRFSIQTLKLLPEDSEERNSFRSKLKGVFSSSSLPALSLQVEVSIPKRVVAAPGAAFPCLVSVRRRALDVEDTRQVPQSSVQIRRFEIEVCSHTEARTRWHKDHKKHNDALGSGSGVPIRIQKADEGSGKSNLAYGPDQTEATPTTDLGLTFGARLPNGMTPDFSTYNIAHYHTLELKLRLDCAGEEMKFDLDHLSLEVVPQVARQDPPAWDSSNENGGMSIEQHNDVVPPPSYITPPSYLPAEQSYTPLQSMEKVNPYSTNDNWE